MAGEKLAAGKELAREAAERIAAELAGNKEQWQR
jgi:hypothetical protein